MLTNIQKLIRNSLLLRGWGLTNNESVFTKNSCFLYTDKKNTALNPIESFTYSQEEIQAIINHSHNFGDAELFKKVAGPDACCNPKTDYFLVKNGWVLVKGKYASGLATLTEDDIRVHKDFKSVQVFDAMINEIDDAANRDYLELRGIKQRCVKRKKQENSFRAVPNGESITEGCFVQIQQTSSACSLFKEGACFKILIIAEEGIIVSVVKNGVATNNNYEIPADVILKEAVDKNLIAVDIVPDAIDVTYDSWESFSSEDIASDLPHDVVALLTSDEQRAAVMEAFSKHLNFTILLNDNIAPDAYSVVLEMLKYEYVNPNLLNIRIRESIAKIWEHYLAVGLEPDRYIDDSFDQIALEECIKEELSECTRYREHLSKNNLSDDVVDFLYKYRFKFGKELDFRCDESTRWQFLLPYLYDKYLSREMMDYFSNLIKMYGSLTDDGCYLKIDFLDAASKGALLNYFKAPIKFQFLGKDYEETLIELMNSPIRIAFSRAGMAIKGEMYSLWRDMNSLSIRTVTNKNVWRCCFINEKAIISCDDSSMLYI